MNNSFKMLSSIINMYIVLFFMMTKIMYGQSLCSCEQPDSNFASNVNLLYYKCNNETPATIAYPINEPQTLFDVLDKDKQTIFYVYGYKQFPQDPNVQLMMDALCYGRTDNVVLLDWSKYSNGLYTTVFENAEKVGRLFAHSIKQLVNRGLNASKIYIVGHSLGTHIAGFVGKCNDFKISRITALDPANPLFYPLGCYLTSNDALWVDVYHTDMFGYGTPISTGTADYFINGGIRPQPGCEDFGLPLSEADLCSHQKSVEVYAKSKRYPIAYDITKCSSYRYFLGIVVGLNDCKQMEQIDIGYRATNRRGLFFFNINV